MRIILVFLLTLVSLVLFSCKKDSTGPSSNGAPISASIIDISHNGTLGYTFGLKPSDQYKRFETFVTDSAHLNLTGIDVKIRRNDSTSTYNSVVASLYRVDTISSMPTDSLASVSFAVTALKDTFTVVNIPFAYHGLSAGKGYAIVLSQVTSPAVTNPGFEWCTKSVSTRYYFGKYEGGHWVNESGLGDGWMIVYLNNVN